MARAARIAITAAGTLLVGSPVLAAPVDVFGTWTFGDLMPDLQAQFLHSYNSMGPIARLVMGALIAAFAIDVLLWLVVKALRGEEEE